MHQIDPLFRKKYVASCGVWMWLVFACVLYTSASWGLLTVHGDRVEWEAAAVDEVYFPLTPANLMLASQSSSFPSQPPVPDSNLGDVLTFFRSSTPLPVSTQFEIINDTEPGSGWVYDDREAGVSQFGPLTLSVGEVGQNENDDFLIVFDSPGASAVAFDLLGNEPEGGELLQLFSLQGDLLISFPLNFITTDTPGLPESVDFIGITSTEIPIGALVIFEASGPDNIGLTNFSVGAAIPEPAGFVSLAVSLFGYTTLLRRTRKS